MSTVIREPVEMFRTRPRLRPGFARTADSYDASLRGALSCQTSSVS